MRFDSLASSSHGNAYIVSDMDTRILLECGVSWKKLREFSYGCGFSLSGFQGCLVSHEHKDHSKCVSDIVASGIPVYMSDGTAEKLDVVGVQTISHGEPFTIGTIDVMPFTTWHDAKEPLGFRFKSQIDGEVLVFATDTVNLAYRFPGVTILAIEANYDKEILARCERMPEKVRHRITNSHMEIDVLCNYLRSLDLSNCREIYLLHLSDATSHEGHFINKVRRAVPGHIKVTACAR